MTAVVICLEKRGERETEKPSPTDPMTRADLTPTRSEATPKRLLTGSGVWVVGRPVLSVSGPVGTTGRATGQPGAVKSKRTFRDRIIGSLPSGTSRSVLD